MNMLEVETTVRKWGNSLGVTLPRDVVDVDGIKENQTVRLLVIKADDTMKRTFGRFRNWKKTGQQLKDEIRAELHG